MKHANKSVTVMISDILCNGNLTEKPIPIDRTALACVAGFASRLFAVIRFESIIHEFDPWFNYRATAYMVKHDFYEFLNWQVLFLLFFIVVKYVHI